MAHDAIPSLFQFLRRPLDHLADWRSERRLHRAFNVYMGRPNVDPYGRWYGWPWYSRLRLGTRRQRAEVWLLGKRYDLAVRLVGRERAKPFDYLPF